MAKVIWTDEAGMHAAARAVGKRRFGRAQVISQTQADPQVTVGASGATTAAWTAESHGAWRIGAAAARALAARGDHVTLLARSEGVRDVASPAAGLDPCRLPTPTSYGLTTSCLTPPPKASRSSA